MIFVEGVFGGEKKECVVWLFRFINLLRLLISFLLLLLLKFSEMAAWRHPLFLLSESIDSDDLCSTSWSMSPVKKRKDGWDDITMSIRVRPLHALNNFVCSSIRSLLLNCLHSLSNRSCWLLIESFKIWIKLIALSPNYLVKETSSSSLIVIPDSLILDSVREDECLSFSTIYCWLMEYHIIWWPYEIVSLLYFLDKRSLLLHCSKFEHGCLLLFLLEDQSLFNSILLELMVFIFFPFKMSENVLKLTLLSEHLSFDIFSWSRLIVTSNLLIHY